MNEDENEKMINKILKELKKYNRDYVQRIILPIEYRSIQFNGIGYAFYDFTYKPNITFYNIPVTFTYETDKIVILTRGK